MLHDQQLQALVVEGIDAALLLMRVHFASHVHELQDALHRASADLPDRAQFVLMMREISGYQNRDLAEALGITEARASQLVGDALEQMREHIGDSFLDAA